MKAFYPKTQRDRYFDILEKAVPAPLLPYREQLHVAVFERGDYLSHYNVPIGTLYYLVSGKAKIYMIHDDGKQTLVQFVGDNNYIGELSLLGAEDVPKDVIALQQCICIALPFEQGNPGLLSNPAFLRHLCIFLAQKLLLRTERFSESLNYPLKNRLAAFILFTAHERTYTEKHVETAEYLGISYRHLLYAIRRFCDDGILIKQKKGHHIADLHALQVLAKDIKA